MNNGEKLSTNTEATINAWDDLQEIEFAGNKPKFTPNQSYIEDFGRKELRGSLGNQQKLKNIQESYLSQYDPDSKASAYDLSLKESLDHFVVERLTSGDPEMFIQSPEFKNYCDYIMNLADSKKFESSNGKRVLYPEFSTNPVFKDQAMRELIFKTAHPNANLENMNAWCDQHDAEYKKTIEHFVENGMKKRNRLSQKQMDIVGDYIYSGKNFDDGVAETYAKYCFNDIRPDFGLKASTPMLGALANYFINQYTIDDEVRKNSRIVIANRFKDYQGDDRDLHIGRSTSYGCILEANHFSQMSLTSDNSLNKSRTNLDENNDLYRFMMISFHELTHDHQKNMVKKGDEGSSSMMYIMRQVLRRGSGCYVSKNGKVGDYYDANHDNDEIEVQADEEAWRQCRAFLVKHQKAYAEEHRDKELYEEYTERRDKCKSNEEEVRARRSFTKKLANTGEEFNAIKYDIETLKTTIQKNPGLLKKYPQLTDYVDASGALKPEIFVSKKIARREFEGLDMRDDVFGSEIGTYMLRDGEERDKLLNFIRNNADSLSTDQLKTIIGNLSHIVHQTVEKSRALNDVNIDNYDETRARGKNFDMTELRTSILKQYLILCRNSIYLAETIKARRPEMTDRIDEEERVYLGAYYRELSQRTSLPPDYREKMILGFRKTGNPVLIGIADQMEG